ncbi:atrophin-1 interacting 2 (WW domain containing E3 ubiquitin ligase 2) [Fusarium agapanthi]|uniref:Chitin synthase n=1 Tax=Fusarium agapanthi TaxID=1803897 RepID=A0A9P5AYG9_9HYPO|nr:atrophin-1 interacting 2 (WW domain containing E3 ubiquitin ligase 2) [Fusarium agapanthi]
MSDPITASIQIGISAVKAGASIATWWELRQRNKREEGQGSTSSGRGAGLDEIYLVFASLGQRLMALDAVNYDALPQALAAVKVAMDISEDDLTFELERLDPILQYLIACGFMFCAACHPMPIYYGYGCGVMNDTNWSNPEKPTYWNVDIDQAIAYLKSVPHPFQLLKKSPSRIGHSEPYYEKYNKKALKAETAVISDVFKQIDKVGYPQPLPPNDNIRINTWSMPFATYGGSIMYANVGHDTSLIMTWQLDPGRFLYAWTVGERADLRPGEAVLLQDEHIGALASWLEGLNGMTFKVLLDSDLDWSKLKLKSSTKKFCMAQSGNEYNITGIPDVIVRNPDPTALLAARLDTLHMVSVSVPFTKVKEQATTSQTPSSPTPSSPQPQRVFSSPPALPQSQSTMSPLSMPEKTAQTQFYQEPEVQSTLPWVDSTPMAQISPHVPIPHNATPDPFTPLPTGWESRLTPDGQIYYVNHTDQTTSWTKPVAPVLAPLSPGWQEMRTPDGIPYYADHNTHTTSWERPPPAEPTLPTDQSVGAEIKSEQRAQSVSARKSVSASTTSTMSSMPFSDKRLSMSMQSEATTIVSNYQQSRVKLNNYSNPHLQRPRQLLNPYLYPAQGKTACWVADVPVTPDIYQKLPSDQYETSYIRHTALAGQPTDLKKLDYSLRQRGRTELVIALNLHNESTFKREVINAELINSLGSILEVLRTHSFARDFNERCNGSPLSGIVVCILIHQDRMKEVPWLRQTGISFLWDIPSSVPLSDSKKANGQFYDDAHKATRKILGKEVKLNLNEYTTTFHLQDWERSHGLMPDVVSGADPVQIVLCSTYRSWTGSYATDSFKHICNLLDARLCISVPGGTTVTGGSLEKQWQLSQYRKKPAESGQDAHCEEYMG